MTEKKRREDCWFAFDLTKRSPGISTKSEGKPLMARCSLQNCRCQFYDKKKNKIVDSKKCELNK